MPARNLKLTHYAAGMSVAEASMMWRKPTQFTTGRQGAMRKLLAGCFFSLALVAGASVQASAQDKVVDKTKDAGAAVADKAGDAKDATVKGTKKAGHETKKVASKTADKAGD